MTTEDQLELEETLISDELAFSVPMGDAPSLSSSSPLLHSQLDCEGSLRGIDGQEIEADISHLNLQPPNSSAFELPPTYLNEELVFDSLNLSHDHFKLETLDATSGVLEVEAFLPDASHLQNPASADDLGGEVDCTPESLRQHSKSPCNKLMTAPPRQASTDRSTLVRVRERPHTVEGLRKSKRPRTKIGTVQDDIQARPRCPAAAPNRGEEDPCVHCFIRCKRNRKHECVTDQPHSARGEAACRSCFDKRTPCEPMPRAVLSHARSLWAEKATMQVNAFNVKYRTIRKAIIHAEPTTRQGMEKRMREDLYLEASRMVDALQRVRRVREALDEIVNSSLADPAHVE